MLAKFFVALFAVLTVALAEVVKLTPESFEELLTSGKYNMFVRFCGNCNGCADIKPIWASLADLYNNPEDPAKKNLIIGEMIFDDHREYVRRNLYVNRHPAMVLYEKNATVGLKFKGERTLEELVAFVNNNLA